MKKLLALLLLPWSAYAADIDLGTFTSCPGTGDYYASGACPCDLSTPQAGPNVDATTADGSVVLTGTNCAGTLHACMIATADTPNRADCISNTGVVDKNTSSPSGAGTQSFSGASEFTGSAETQYKIEYYLVPTNYPNRNTFDNAAITATFTTNATLGGGGADLTGQGLFVAKNDGGNSDETTVGTSGSSSPAGCTQHFASPCADLSEPSPAVSQDIYLAEGGVWNDETMTISQSGNASDQLVVSCYYNNAGTPNQCSSF